MSAILRLTVPFPVSLNNLYPTVGKRRFKSPRARVFEEAVVASVWRWAIEREKSEKIVEAITPPFFLRLDLYPPDRRRHDASNCCKVVEDAVFKAIGFDDNLVTRIEIVKHPVDRERPRCEVTVTTDAGYGEETHGGTAERIAPQADQGEDP